MVGSASCSSPPPHHKQGNQEEVHLQTDLSPPPAVAGQLHHQIQLHPHNHQDDELMMMMSRLSSTPPSSIYLRQLLLTCAHSISHSDFTAAHRITTILSSKSSPYGDSSERLINSFTKALSLRLHNINLHPPPDLITFNNIINTTAATTTTATTTTTTTFTTDYMNSDDAILQSSYLSLNQITPFIRFTHLTANQAILEAINDHQYSHHQHHNNNLQQQQHPHDIHILDFDIMQGVQWPPLMQAIADRQPPATLRITATGTNLDILRRTGDRLSKFAHSLGLRFRFFPLLLPDQTNNNNNNNQSTVVDDVINHLSAVLLLPNEILAVNCVLYLHRLLITDRDKLCLLLRKIKSMNPKVITLAENEANHNHPIFVSRFEEALSYYAAVFDSLEATLPPNSRERMAVEQVWFGREIADIVAAEGMNRRERHERYLSWEMMMRIAGFRNVALSPFALSQAKLLLRLHYPSEGYNLEVVNGSFFLGWQNQPLFSVSSWH